MTAEPKKIKKGVALAGVNAGTSSICTVGHTGNDLHYRGYDIIAMPTIDDFAEMFKNETNYERFYSSKGAHYKPHQQKWLMLALLAWVRNQNVDMALCLGWNCPNPRILGEELVAQSNLIARLLRKAQQDTQ